MELHAHLDGDLDLDPVSGSLVDLLGPEGPGGQQVLRSVCPHTPILLAAHWWARVFLPYVSAPLWGDRDGAQKELEGSADLPGGPLRASPLPDTPRPVFSASSGLCDFCALGRGSSLPPLGVWHLLSQTGQSWVLQWGQEGD